MPYCTVNPWTWQDALGFANLGAVLRQAGYGLGDVVRLTCYTTDVDALFAQFGAVTARLDAAGCRPASTLLGVTRLAYPELLVEVEAAAVRGSR